MNEDNASVNQADLKTDKPVRKPWSAPELNSLTRRNTDAKLLNTVESGPGGNYPGYGPS